MVLFITSGSGAVSDTQLENTLGLASGTLDRLRNGNATEGRVAEVTTVTVSAGTIITFDWNFSTNEHNWFTENNQSTNNYAYNDFTENNQSANNYAYNDFTLITIGNQVIELVDTRTTLASSSSSSSGTFSHTFTEAGTYTISAGVVDVGDSGHDSALTVENVNIVAPSLGTIQGIVYNDLNGNGNQDAGETGIQGRTVFLDANQNGILDTGETSTTTSSTGSYRFENINSGTYSIAQVQEEGWKNTGPKVVVEPDNYEDGTVLDNKVPGVTLGKNINAETNYIASTGVNVFAWRPKSTFFQGPYQLNANFDSPVTTVSIDFIDVTDSKNNIGE